MKKWLFLVLVSLTGWAAYSDFDLAVSGGAAVANANSTAATANISADGTGTVNYKHDGMADGLVAFYPFNGNANDESGHGNNATVVGSTLSADRFGHADKFGNLKCSIC